MEGSNPQAMHKSIRAQVLSDAGHIGSGKYSREKKGINFRYKTKA